MNTVVAIVAALFALMGVAALVAPARILAIFGVSVTTVDGRNEISAVYGGYGVATGLVLAMAIVEPALRAGVLIAVSAALFGMAGGRLIAALRDRAPGPYPWIFFMLEIVGAAALGAAAMEGRPW